MTNVCHVCHDVCGVCGNDRQVDHCEDKSFCRYKSTPYLCSFSSLSSALSIPNSKIHLQKLLGPSVCRTTTGCAPAVAPALGVAQQSELPHAQIAHRHRPSPCGPCNAVETRTRVFVFEKFEHRFR